MPTMRMSLALISELVYFFTGCTLSLWVVVRSFGECGRYSW